MAEFLLELFSEEIPARMQARAATELKRLVTEGLQAAGLTWDNVEAHSTPRRLALWADGLPTTQPQVAEERRGPREDAPASAIEGFLRATGLTLEQCELRETGKGRVWFATVTKGGRPTAELLGGIVSQVLAGLPWPKSMRWGDGQFRWVRPLHHVLALFGGRPLPGAAGPDAETRFAFTGQTRGHRFMAPDAVEVEGVADYQAKLRQGFVLLDREERKSVILAEANRLAAAEGLRLRDDPGLLEEVAGLVEWPVVLIGRIDEAFMTVPPEVLITAMRTHQRYFSLLDAEGRLAPRFIVVAGTVTRDGGAAVVDGNERVLRARLADARFFWDHDRRTPLADLVPALAQIVFHERLGTMADKAGRIAGLARSLAGRVPGADPDAAERAARLAKADLVSGMVGEFPELQGVMGRYYALEQGEPAAIADAIAQHYAPLGPGDRCPTEPVAVTVALADKLDTLAGFFAIDERPTGSRDPYALRRAALGVIRLILENGLRLSLRAEFGRALQLYDKAGTGVEDQLLDFFADRLKVALREQGVRHDLIDAVFALGDEDDLVRLLARVEALGAFLGSEDGGNLLTAYRRAANIVRIEGKKDKLADYGAVDPARLVESEERQLAERLAATRSALDERLAAEDFAGAMSVLAGLRGPVDAFFDRVTVNAEEATLRRNRLALLGAITGTMNRVADFSRIEG